MKNNEKNNQADNNSLNDSPAAKLEQGNGLSYGSEKLKAIVYPLIIVVVGVALFLGLSKLKRAQDPVRNGNIIEMGPQISAEERQALETQVGEIEQEIKNLPDNASAPQRFRLYRQLAGAWYRLGEFDKALAALDTVASDNQNNAALWTLYTLIYRDKEDLAKARETARRAVDADKANPNNWLVYIELSPGQGTETINNIYQEALKNADPQLDIVTAYARFLEASGNKQGAIEQWQRAGQLDPANKPAYDGEIARLQGA